MASRGTTIIPTSPETLAGKEIKDSKAKGAFRSIRN